MFPLALVGNTEPLNLLCSKVLPRPFGMMKPPVSREFSRDTAKGLLPSSGHIGQGVDVSKICAILLMGDHKPISVDREAYLGTILCGSSPLSLLDGHNMGFIKAVDFIGNMMTQKTLSVLDDDPLGEFFQFG